MEYDIKYDGYMADTVCFVLAWYIFISMEVTYHVYYVMWLCIMNEIFAWTQVVSKLLLL